MAWLRGVVIGLNLCPFAAPVLKGDRLGLVVSGAVKDDELFLDLQGELDRILSTPAETLSTTILAAPRCLPTFDEYLNFLDAAESLLDGEGLRGVLQIASFHPLYTFEGEGEGRSAYTNRAPYPLFHILREAEVGQAIASHPDPRAIPTQNIQRLESLDSPSFEAIRRLSLPTPTP